MGHFFAEGLLDYRRQAVEGFCDGRYGAFEFLNGQNCCVRVPVENGRAKRGRFISGIGFRCKTVASKEF
jgi:hypothetical protein